MPESERHVPQPPRHRGPTPPAEPPASEQPQPPQFTPPADLPPGTGNVSGPQPSGEGPQLPAATDSGPALCGEPHKYKTSKGEEKEKPCIKARGHSGPHSSRAINPKVDMSVLADTSLEVEDVPGDDDSELLDELTVRERSEQQIAVDKAVAAAHAKWVAAGKPKGINEAIKKNAASRFRVAPEQLPAVRKMLQLAETAPDNKGRHVKRPPARKHADGSVMQYFIVVDKQTKESTATPAPEPAAAAS